MTLAKRRTGKFIIVGMSETEVDLQPMKAAHQAWNNQALSPDAGDDIVDRGRCVRHWSLCTIHRPTNG